MSVSVGQLPLHIKKCYIALAQDSCETEINTIFIYITKLCEESGEYVPEMHILATVICNAMISNQVNPKNGYLILLGILQLRPGTSSLIINILGSGKFNVKSQITKKKPRPFLELEDEYEKTNYNEEHIEEPIDNEILGFIYGYIALLRSCSFGEYSSEYQSILENLMKLRLLTKQTLNIVGHFMFNFMLMKIKKPFGGASASQLCDDFDTILNVNKNREFLLCRFFTQKILKLLDRKQCNTVHLVFTAAHLILPLLTEPKYIEVVLCEPVIQCLMDANNMQDFGVTTGAHSLMTVILDMFAKYNDENSSVQLAMLKQFIYHPGTLHFDRFSGTKLIAQAQQLFSARTTIILSEELKRIYYKQYRITMNHQGYDNFNDTTELYQAIIWLTFLVNLPVMRGLKHLKWKIDTISFVVKNVFFVWHIKKFDTTMLRFAYSRLLQPSSSLNMQSVLIEGVEENTYYLLKGHSRKKASLTTEAAKKWEIIHKHIESLKLIGPLTVHDTVLKALLCHLVLHLMVNEGKTMELLDKTITCLKPTDISEHDWVWDIIGILIELLHMDEAMWRPLSKLLFRNILPFVSVDTVEMLVQIVVEFVKVDQEEIGVDENNPSSDEESDDDSVSSSDDCFSSNDESSSDSEPSDEEDEGADTNSEVMSKADQRRQEQLLIMKEVAMGTDGDIDLDAVPEEELMKLDKKLGAMFGKYNNPKKNLDELQMRRDVVHRIRVCDLLFILVKYSTRIDQCLCMCTPLLLGFKKMLERQLKQEADLLIKIKALIFTMGKGGNFESFGSATLKHIAEQMDELAELGNNHLTVIEVELFRSTFTSFFRYGLFLASTQPEIGLCSVLGAFNRTVLQTFFKRKSIMDSSILFQAIDVGHPYSFELAYPLAQVIFYFGENVQGRKNTHSALNTPSNLKNPEIDMENTKTTDQPQLDEVNDPKGCANPEKMYPEETVKHVAHIYKKGTGCMLLKKMFDHWANMYRMSEVQLIKLQSFISKSVIEELDHYKRTEQIVILFMVPMFHLLHTINKLHTVHPQLNAGFDWNGVRTSLLSFYERIPLKPMMIVRRSFHSLASLLRVNLSLAHFAYTEEEELKLVKQFNEKRKGYRQRRLQNFNAAEFESRSYFGKSDDDPQERENQISAGNSSKRFKSQ